MSITKTEASPLSVQPYLSYTRREKSLTTYLNAGLVVRLLDYADVVWRDQPGLTTQMKQLQSFQSHIAKKIVKGKVTSAEGYIRGVLVRIGVVLCNTDVVTANLC